MKPTAANPNAATQHQSKDSRLKNGPGAATAGNQPITEAAASQRTEGRAKRGEPLRADPPRERSPKQENL
jgi:hypothetical protein